MKMHTVVAGFALWGAIVQGGCGSSPPPPPTEMDNRDGGTTTTGTDGGSVDYPKGTPGFAVGNEIADLHFLAHLNPIQDVGKDPVSLSLADIYAMRASGAKLLYLSGAAEWCGPCNMEADGLVAALADANFQSTLTMYGGPQALVIVQVLFQNADTSPADRSTIDRWANAHKTSYIVGIDPKSEVSTYFNVQAIPQSIFVRISDMTILGREMGFGGTQQLETSLGSYLSKAK